MKLGLLLSVVVSTIILSSVNLADAQCPTVVPMQNFNASLFTGRWYEIKRFRTALDAFGGSCSSVNFTVNSSNNITVALSTYISSRLFNTTNCAAMKSNGVLDWKFSFGPSKTTKIIPNQIAYFRNFQSTLNSNTTSWTPTTITTLQLSHVEKCLLLELSKLPGFTDAAEHWPKHMLIRPLQLWKLATWTQIIL